MTKKSFLENNTIVAHCTPSGPGALALLRVSGPDAIAIVNRCAQLSSKKELQDVQTHTIHHGWVIDSNKQTLDEVMFFVMHGPKTFTGTTVVEITTHNNQFIIESVIQRIIECGARQAQKGEFARQAVENGKIDLIQAEAINELIHANSEQLLKQSLSQLKGSFSHWINIIEKQLLKLVGLCEASFEFIEEEIDFKKPMQESLAKIFDTIKTVKKSFDQQQQLRNGIRIALIGSVNAGKSSLFNALIGKNRAIVTSIAGTTRDVIEAGIYKNGTYLTLIDTAGLRKTEDIIEKEGIEKSYYEAKSADIVLLVIDASRVISPEEKAVYQTITSEHQSKVITIYNKSDQQIILPKNENAICVSALKKDGIALLENQIEQKIKHLFLQNNSPFLLNKRQFNLLIQAEKELKIIESFLYQDVQDYEIIAYHLKETLKNLTELTGKTVTEKTFDTIFKEFCVGK